MSGAGPPVAGLLNWLSCFDLWDRVTGRWIFRLPKDEQETLAQDEQGRLSAISLRS